MRLNTSTGEALVPGEPDSSDIVLDISIDGDIPDFSVDGEILDLSTEGDVFDLSNTGDVLDLILDIPLSL